jgi:hypothetical protein
MGARRAGLVDAGRGRVAATSPDLGEIRAVVGLEEGTGYAALGDDGALNVFLASVGVVREFRTRAERSAAGPHPAA